MKNTTSRPPQDFVTPTNLRRSGRKIVLTQPKINFYNKT